MHASSAGKPWNGEPIPARTDSTSESSTQHVRSIMCAPFMSHIPPPVARSRNHGRRISTPNGCTKDAKYGCRGDDLARAWSRRKALTVPDQQALLHPLDRPQIRSHSTVSAIGFSRKMLLTRPSTVACRRKFGSATVTRWMSRFRTSSESVKPDIRALGERSALIDVENGHELCES
jgi:hypothetical protein